MNLKEQRAAAYKAAQDIIDGAKGRDLSDDEQATFDAKLEDVKSLDAKIKSADESQARVKMFSQIDPGKEGKSTDDAPAMSLGEHFMKHAGSRLREIKGVSGAVASAPEYKAATDPHLVSQFGVFQTPVLTDFDRTTVRPVQRRLIIADLIGSGAISGNAITYLVEGAIEGDFTTVAEGGAKPQLHFAQPTTVTDTLKKIAGFIKFSDEMLEDLDFFVSEINGRLLTRLAQFEEDQILSGNGTGTNVSGILNRSGRQTVVSASANDNADAIFRAITAVSTATGLDADGIVIHPTDYQTLRLRKDANNQYYGGGFFSGQYGNGGIMEQPPLWGLRTVVSPTAPLGAPIVGAWNQGATLYRKGGVRVESTNSHASDFTNNLVTVRAEERVALAVRVPAAFASVTLSAV